MMLMKVENLSVPYENRYVLKDISFEVEQGDYLCIVGENGGGKSTLVKSILGLLPYKEGKVELSDMRIQDVGYLSQQTNIQAHFPASVMEIVLSGCLNHGKFSPFYTKEQKEKALYHLKELGIEDLKNCCYKELSGGQQQRVLLARALCATSKMLILDEPTTGLDPSVTKDFYQLLYKINQDMGITIVMVTHDLDHALESANKILHVHHTVHFFGSTAEYGECEICKNWGLS